MTPVSASGATGTADLLILDDNPGVRRALRRNAEFYGCTVVEAGTVAEATAALEGQVVSGLSIDLDLKDGQGTEGGLDFLKWLRKERQVDAPAIILTGTLEELVSIKPTRLRARYLHKPVAPNCPELSRFLGTTASWTSLRLQLRDIVDTHPSLDERHFELMQLYLYLGGQALPMALGLSRAGFYKRFAPIKAALGIENIHMLWQHLRIDPRIAGATKK